MRPICLAAFIVLLTGIPSVFGLQILEGVTKDSLKTKHKDLKFDLAVVHDKKGSVTVKLEFHPKGKLEHFVRAELVMRDKTEPFKPGTPFLLYVPLLPNPRKDDLTTFYFYLDSKLAGECEIHLLVNPPLVQTPTGLWQDCDGYILELKDWVSEK